MEVVTIPLATSASDLAVARRGNKSWRRDPGDPRTDFDSDLDKVLYSEALRRLEYVTQVVPAGAGRGFHSRAVHSHKVSQVARAIANRLLWSASEVSGEVDWKANAAQIERFGGLDPTVAAAGALIHDLGHPPFGHAGESALDQIARRIWGIRRDTQDALSFEGNAQSLRIISELEQHKVDETGIKLTNATINASLKYPWSYRPGRTKYSAYESERHRIVASRSYVASALGNKRTLEAEIVDIADDITYAVHDVEDFFRAGIIPLHDIGTASGAQFAKLCESVKSAWVAQIRPMMALAHDPDYALSTTARALYNLDLASVTAPPSLVDVRSLLGSVPSDEEIGRCIRTSLASVPPNGFDGDLRSIGALREVSSQMIGMLLGQIGHCEVFGARLKRQGRIVVLTLKCMAQSYVFQHSSLREIQAAEASRLRFLAEHFARFLGLHLIEALDSPDETDRLGQRIESELLQQLRRDHWDEASDADAARTSVRGSRVPPTWPGKFQSRFRTAMEELLQYMPSDADGAFSAVTEASRRDRGRLLLDVLASMSEDEVDALADSLLGMRARQPRSWIADQPPR